MRCSTLHVGDLVYIHGIKHIIGMVVGERRTDVYDIHVLQDNNIFTFPRGILVKLDITEIA